VPRNQPLYAIIMRRVGFREGFRVVDFVLSWALAHADLGRAPTTIDEYVEWWNDGRAAKGKGDIVSRATAFRHQQAFRECFEPEGFETPADLFEALGIDPADFGVRTLHEAVLT
jgi:hypothetical protein